MSGKGWRPVALGEALTEDRERVAVEPDDSYPIAGVYGFGRGVLLRDAVCGSEVSASHLYRIAADQIIYSRLKAFEGAFALVPAEANGRFVSNEFPTFTVNQTRALPAFIALALSVPRVWRELTERSVGVGARRERLQVADFLEFEIDLPPIDQQRMILGFADSATAAWVAACEEREAAAALLTSVREQLAPEMAEDVLVGEVVVAIKSGTSPRCLDRAPETDEWGVLKTSSVRPGEFRPAEAKALPHEVPPAEAAEVRGGDVLAIRASGSRHLVGSVCRVMDGVRGRLLMSDYHWRLQLDEDRVDPDYFVEAMALADTRSQIEDLASGSTTAGKISQASLKEVEIPLPSLDHQAQIVTSSRPAHETLTACESQADVTGRLRSCLIEELISGDRRVSAPR